MLAFKGILEEQIEQHQFPTLIIKLTYLCQKNAWMNEDITNKGIEEILQLYVENVPAISVSDSYRYSLVA